MKRWARRAAAVALTMAAVGGGTTQAAVIDVTTNVTASETWTSDNTYILTQVIYVTNGATLTIEPGTVIRGEGESSPGANDPGTLVITRDSKIQALGTKDHPIVFTDLNDDNIGNNPGTFPYDTLDNALSQVANWGGVILLGRTYVANNTAGAANPAREVQIEGLTPAGGLGLYGNGGNDNDDSGTMRYVSIRYGGFNLSANNEINGLTLGAVGRNTDLEYIEVMNSKDDGIESFGGTETLKHIILANLGDDSLDYDEGFRGKGQFIFLMQGTPGTDRGDKGGEHDGGNGPDTSLPMSMPTLYNVTSVGLGGTKAYTNSLTNTGIHFRDNAGGRYYNSFFADFGGAPFMIEGGSLSTGGPTDAGTSGERAITPYVVDGNFYLGPAGGNQLELKDDYWWCTGNGGVVPSGDATAVGGDSGKYHFDGVLPDGDGNTMVNDPNFNNTYAACGTTPPMVDFLRIPVANPAVPDIIGRIDPRPTPAGPLTSTTRTPPNDGFFEPAAYKGAFAPGHNWANGWSSLSRVQYFGGCAAGAMSSSPDLVENLRIGGLLGSDPDLLRWDAPAGADGSEMYDVLRASSGAGFGSALCLESNDGTDMQATDTAVPAAGSAFFYLVRANNSCADGSLGTNTLGSERTGVACP